MAAKHKDPHRVVKAAQRISGTEHPTMDTVNAARLKEIANSVCKDCAHPRHSLFKLLPSGTTNRLRNSFYYIFYLIYFPFLTLNYLFLLT